MPSLIYQHTIIGCHGCDRALVEDVLLGRKRLKASHNNYDWLGEGINFWESHIQVVIRDSGCILGCFLPET
jgi:hypothetical protein